MSDTADDARQGPPQNCTCHPEDHPPMPCPRKHALRECKAIEVERLASEISHLTRKLNAAVRYIMP